MAEKENNQLEGTFKLSRIELLDLSVITPERQVVDGEQFHFHINLEHRINPDKKLVFVIPSIEVQLGDDKIKVGSIKVSCIYNIRNFEDFYNDKKDSIPFRNELMNLLNSISLSTTRGVMFSSFSGTILQNAILPVLDMKAFKHNADK